jgi:hypothetical protein
MSGEAQGPGGGGGALAVLACEVLREEVETLIEPATRERLTALRFLEVALHDRPDFLRKTLQEAIDAIEAAGEARSIVLVYALCGRGIVGLGGRGCRVVAPRAHDCITLYLGSRERYEAVRAEDPETYWYSPGWNRARRVPSREQLARKRAELAESFDEEDVDYLMEMEEAGLAAYSKAGYTDLGIGPVAREKAYARGCAESLGWGFRHHPGDPALLRDLLNGR